MQRPTIARILNGWCAVAVVLGLAPTGCSRPKSDRLETYPASGILLMGDKPAAGARVQLNPVDDAKLAGLYPHAIVQKDGSFQLTTYKTRDGAPAGTYALTVTWPLPPRPNREEGPDRFQGRYSDRRRPVAQVRISAGENNLGTIHLSPPTHGLAIMSYRPTCHRPDDRRRFGLRL